MTAVFVLTLPIIVIAAMLGHSWASDSPAETMATASQTSAAGPRGEAAFKTACVVCHGPGGAGVPHLGKPLRNSAFVQEQTDEELFALLAQGRLPTDPANTTGVLMPARGAQNLSDDKLHDVIAYLREIQDPSQPIASVDAWVIAKPDDARGADTGDAADGAATAVVTGLRNELFVSSCSACHGEFGQGVEGLGKPLGTSEFVRSKTDKELITFIKTGRPLWDAENTTGIDMPPKGGNPALSDEDLLEIVAYIRSLSK
ncbi:MAG: c-type cytochrome [Planctomycetota bacterium]|nr:c-type cytochrome [Planctomycetota bacterium]